MENETGLKYCYAFQKNCYQIFWMQNQSGRDELSAVQASAARLRNR